MMINVYELEIVYLDSKKDKIIAIINKENGLLELVSFIKSHSKHNITGFIPISSLKRFDIIKRVGCIGNKDELVSCKKDDQYDDII